MKAIVVLGARINLDPNNGKYSPSPMLRMRLDKTYEKYLEGTDDLTTIITSGGSPHGETVTESSVMRDFLLEKGVPSCKIFEEDKSNNTLQNCFQTYALLDCLERERLTLQELIPNFQCNYSGSNVSGEAPPFEEICVVTSDFHSPRSRIIFERFNKKGLKLTFIEAPTPKDIAPEYFENEKRIMAGLI